MAFGEKPDALFNLDLRMITELFAGFGDIGVGNRDVTRLQRLPIDRRFGAQCVFQERDQSMERDFQELLGERAAEGAITKAGLQKIMYDNPKRLYAL